MPDERRIVLLRRVLLLAALFTLAVVRAAGDTPGSTRVIVRLGAGFHAEGELAGAAAVTRQRAAIARGAGDSHVGAGRDRRERGSAEEGVAERQRPVDRW